ncbi:MAG: aspartate aminotransferase family protein [Eubacterium sp.]|nr:aspartate aminotransferase family protein [Candidatus Colimonas fimequi]
MEKFVTEKSKALFEEGKKYLVDGVSSSFHVAPCEEYPIAMIRGKGARMYDIDGNEYIDYIAGFGPTILGYAPDALNEAVADQLTRGVQFSTPTEALYKLAKKLTEIIPCAEMVSFQSSGTEANMHAWRVARAATGKMKIVKFEGQYHGWADEQKITIGADNTEQLGARTNITRIMTTAGQRKSTTDDIILAPWNDIDTLTKIVEENADEIAAVLMEPYMCDEGPILGKEGYLEAVRELCTKNNVLLIFDEVITGFRMSLGGAQEYFGVTPDIGIFGKAIAGGISLSMIAGKKEHMELCHPSGTFNATPVAVAASLATIAELEKPGTYERMDALGAQLCDAFIRLGKENGIKTYANHHNGISQFQFGIDRAPEDWRDVLDNVDSDMYDKFYNLCRDYGVRLTSMRGREYLSAAHTQEDIDRTIAVFEHVFPMLKEA